MIPSLLRALLAGAPIPMPELETALDQVLAGGRDLGQFGAFVGGIIGSFQKAASAQAPDHVSGGIPVDTNFHCNCDLIIHLAI